MSQVHSMELPRKVIVGRDILSTVGDTCRSLGFSKTAFVLTGPLTFELAAKKVIHSLIESEFVVNHSILKESNPNIPDSTQALIWQTNTEVILGVGGGKIIDTAKQLSAKNSIHFISVPTAASHDGISSPLASIREGGRLYSSNTSAPMAIMADLDVIAKSPYRLTASGCGDILAKYTAVRDWWLSHYINNEYYGEYAANLALMSAKIITKKAYLVRENSEEGIRIVVEALISCGVAISIAGSSRPCSGAEHLFSHALDSIAPNHALHGEQCGVGAIMIAYLHRMNWKRIRRVLKSIGAPTTSKELGVDNENVIEALVTAHKIRPERYTILGHKGLSRETAVRLAKNTGVMN